MLYKFTLMSNSTRHINYSALCLASYQSTIRSVPSSNIPQYRSCVQPRTDHRMWRKEAGVEAEEEEEELHLEGVGLRVEAEAEEALCREVGDQVVEENAVAGEVVGP